MVGCMDGVIGVWVGKSVGEEGEGKSKGDECRVLDMLTRTTTYIPLVVAPPSPCMSRNLGWRECV